MKKVFKVGKFVDFAGIEREVIFAAISQELSQGEFFNWSTAEGGDLVKEIRIGVSVQSFKDPIVKTELGKIIAEGKALKEKSCVGKLFSTQKGFINSTVVEALLNQELNFFKQNPGKYIKGYNKDKELFLQNPTLYWTKAKS